MSGRRDKGFALLIVLWSLVLITLLITQLLASGRTAAQLATNTRLAAEAKARADGAIYEAIYHVLSGGADHWAADGSPHVIAGNGITITVRVRSLSGRINPNLASTVLLAGLFQACGAGAEQAQALGQAVIAWRSQQDTKQESDTLLTAYKRAGLPYAPPGESFADLSELAYVMGMTPALLARALPEMSLYQTGDPDPAQSDPVVRQALKLSGQTGTSSTSYSGANPAVAIEAEVDAPGQVTVRRASMVSLAGADAPAPFRLLSLGDGLAIGQ